MEQFDKKIAGGIFKSVQIPALNNRNLMKISFDDFESEPSPNIFRDCEKISFHTIPNPKLIKKIPIKQISFLLHNNEKKENSSDCIILNKTKRVSSFSSILVGNFFSLKEKLFFIFNHFLTVHLLVICMTILKIYCQAFFFEYCWMSTNICHCDDFQTKIYMALIFILVFPNLLILILYEYSIKVIFETYRAKMLSFFVFYGVSFMFIFIYLLTIEFMDTFPILLFLQAWAFVFQIKSLMDYKFKLLLWIKHVLKINILPFLLFIHYFLCKQIFPELNKYIKDLFSSYDMSRNIIKFYQLIYFQIFALLSRKMFKVYHRYVTSFSFNDFSGTTAVVRFCSIFLISVPIAGILSMKKIEDWGCYITLISYSFFIFSFYTRIDIPLYFLKYVYYKIRPQKKSNVIKEDKIDLMCSQLISGCLLDLVILVNSRLIIIILTKKWFAYPFHDGYYENCSFDLNHDFEYGKGAAYAIVGINTFVTISVLIYMVQSRQIIWEYKKSKNSFLNFYCLFMLHGMIEGFIQMILQINEIN